MVKRYLFYLAVLAVVSGLALTAAAQDTTVTAPADLTITETAAVTADSAAADEPEDILEGIEVDELNEAPSNFGLWWRNWRERVSVALTLDPVKKDEKRIKFAEERLKLAELIAAKSGDPQVQEKAQQMIIKANQFLQKIEEHQEKFLQNPDERTQRLLRNAATHLRRKEKVMDKLETVLPVDQLEKFETLRQTGLQQSQRLLNALNNPDLPVEIKEHLEQVKERIEEHAQEVKEWREERRELLQGAAKGDEQAREELKQLNEERREERKQEAERLRETLKQQAEDAEDNDEERETLKQQRETQRETLKQQAEDAEDNDEDDLSESF